jgi:hypothetical protein
VPLPKPVFRIYPLFHYSLIPTFHLKFLVQVLFYFLDYLNTVFYRVCLWAKRLFLGGCCGRITVEHVAQLDELIMRELVFQILAKIRKGF